jgi:hypothetical protein
MDVLENLKQDFNHRVTFRDRRPGVVQIVAPLFHEDGDMVDIFMDKPDQDGKIRISDYGMTLMRLSYSYDVDTPTKRKILARILSENGVVDDNGSLYLEATRENVFPSLLQFAQTVAKISSMQAFKREVIQSLFYETLNDFVSSRLASYGPQQHYVPIKEKNEFDVDWRLPLPGRDIFLYGARDTAKTRLVALSCLEFQRANVQFRSVIVHDDFEANLSKKDRTRITNIADNQFSSLADFESGAEEYFHRENTAA